MRRWLYHYEVSNAIVRLITLTVINWSISAFVNSRIESDQPITIWIILCFILLVSNIIKLLFASSPKYHQKVEDVQSPRINLKSTAVKVLVLPLSVVTFLTMFAALRQMDRLQYTTSQLMHQPFMLNAELKPGELVVGSSASVSLLVVILSSWSSKSFERRQMLRQSSLRLLRNRESEVSVTYRFVVGQPPSARDQMLFGPKLQQESELYQDMLMVPASDLQSHQSRKLFKALQWSTGVRYDYLIKTDDNVFTRWDIVMSELRDLGPKEAYWRGLVYR